MAKKVALLIGVSKYGEGLPPLSAAPNDVAALRRVLENPEMAGFDQVIPLIDPDLAAMQAAIGKFFSDREKDDLLLLYFSGHGIKDGDTNHLYLSNCQTSKEGFRWQAVPASFVQQRSQYCPSRRQVIILDCCFSGAFKDGWTPKGIGLDLQQELGKEGRAVLTSSNEFEQSFQQDTGEALSLYTQYLIEGIETGAADHDKDGNIYIKELHDYAKAKVREVKPKMQPGILSDKEGFEILLSKAPVNDATLDFRRLVEPYAERGEISPRRMEVLRTDWKRLGLTDEAANIVIDSVLEPFRRRLANLKKFETELRKEVEASFPLTADMENELRDWQQKVLGLTDGDVAKIWQQVIAEKTQKAAATPPVRPISAPSPPLLLDPASPLPSLPFISTFEFQVATLRKKTEIQSGILGFGKKEVITYSIDRTQKRAESFTETLSDRVFLEMVAIPAGRFHMGSTEYSDEQPVHQVAIAPFFLGKYPVTQAQWKSVAAFPKVKIDLNPDPATFKGDDRPVERVSWWEAVEFCDRLSRKTNRKYGLPSEAQWEYACRAGTTTPFHFGETITTDLANYRGIDWKLGDTTYPGNYGQGPKGIFREQTNSVGSFKIANAFGLYDMHGNVWEWCADHWHENYEKAPTDGSAWLTNDKEDGRLLRGGCWNGNPGPCRSAFRNRLTPGEQFDFIGFRVVCVSSWTA